VTVTVIVQARTGSTRLPGKVLADLGGQPLLGFMLDRLAGLAVDHLVVATSTLPADDAVVDVARAAGVAVIRGSERDVLGRFTSVLEAFPCDDVVRLTADCPLADPLLVTQALELHHRSGADYSSNTLVRTFPDGLDVEVVTASALREAADDASDPAEREHVTPFVYRRPERYRLTTMRGPEQLGGERWTIDTFADLERVRQIVACLDDPIRAGWRDALAVAGRQVTRHAGAVYLRLAEDGDDDVIGLIDPGATWQPVRDFLVRPSVRTWIAEVDQSPVGWAQIAVRCGVGHLTGTAPTADLAELVRTALAGDLQVRELRTVPIE
jgi:spore coat polysaccharide biosynthesis protein SpsF